MSYKNLAEALLLRKPYFGTALRARQGVLERHQYFLPVVSSIPRERDPLEALEIGSWAGASTVSWALALQEAGRNGKVICVDPWDPYFEVGTDSTPHYRQMNQAAEQGLIFSLFKHNIHAAGVADMVEVRRGTSRAILPDLAEDAFDIVYIDGSHLFEDVSFDIRQAKRLARDGGVVCGDDLEIEAAALGKSELDEGIASKGDYVFSDRTQCWYHPGVTGAVAREFEEVAVWNGFWAVRRSGTRWEPASLDLTDLHMPPHLDEASPACRLLESTPDYNLVEAGGRYFAISNTLGPVDLFEELLGERALPPVLLSGDSLEAVRRASELKSWAALSSPVLMESYRGFNLVAYAGRIYALRQSLGRVNVTDGEVELRRRFGSDQVVVAESAELAKIRIDALVTNEELATLRADLSGLRSDLESRTETTGKSQADLTAAIQSTGELLEGLERQLRTCAPQTDLTAAIQAATERMDGLEALLRTRASETDLAGAVQVAGERMEALEEQLEDRASRADLAAAAQNFMARIDHLEERLRNYASRGDLVIAAQSVTERVDALGQKIERQEASISQNASAQQRQIDETRVAMVDLQSRLESVSRQSQLVGHQVSILQNGPGDPHKPCVAGEHRDFTLVHFQGRVYGLRRPLDPTEVTRGESELMAHANGQVVIGHSVDGVRARIDLLEAARELEAEIDSLQQAIQSTDFRLTEGLREANSALQATRRDLEQQAQRRPNRLFGRLSR